MKTIKLTNGAETLVDDEDFEELNQYKWSVLKNRSRAYAVRWFRLNEKTVTVLMHREIMQTPKGMDTDHIDGDGLNNQRNNLRVCTHSENIKNQGRQSNNTSGYKGAYWNSRYKNWRALISVNGKLLYLGKFPTKELASEAYIEACKKYHGEFANY